MVLVFCAPLLALEIFSAGMDTPETISEAPDEFGAFGGHLFVPDPGPAPIIAGNSKVWRIAPEGGPPSLFAALPQGLGLGFRGGMFLPPDFGSVGGQYIVNGVRGITAFDATGKGTPFVTALDVFIQNRVFMDFATPIMAPDTFGRFAGRLLISYLHENVSDPGGILSITPSARVSHVVTPSVSDVSDPLFRNNVIEPFGLAFAPEGFGRFGGKLMVSDSKSDNIAAVASNGSYESFAHVPLLPGQQFLRQMAFSPDDFGTLGGLLFVSVAGAQQGGEGVGSVHAVNADGQIRGTLRVGPDLREFDPRGLFFTDDGRLLISDAANAMLVATPDDFRIVLPLQAGDADRDLDFDQLDLVRVQIAAKYLTGQPATWGQGDWNGAPGGNPANPPVGNGLFDQLDIVAAFRANTYLAGPYGAVRPGGQASDGQTSIGYHVQTGELWVDAPAGTQLTSINIDSASSIFTGNAALNLGGSFDNDADNNLFKATFGSSFGSLSFGNVAQPGLSQQFVANDLTVVGSLAGGGGLGDVDLIYVPEPSTVVLTLLGVASLVVGCHPRRGGV
jgi:hypothetical protein